MYAKLLIIFILYLFISPGSAFAHPSDSDTATNDSLQAVSHTPVITIQKIDPNLQFIRPEIDLETFNIGFERVPELQKTGAISSLTEKDMGVYHYNNLAEFLRGQVMGLRIGGGPGNYTVHIRGISTLSTGTDPLIIVDGVPTEIYEAMEHVNPYAVKSVDVIKDGTASLYGVRGANGVIVIETK